MNTLESIVVDILKENELLKKIHGIEIKEEEKNVTISNSFEFDLNNMSLLQLLWSKKYTIVFKDITIDDSYYLKNLINFNFFYKYRVILKDCHVLVLDTNNFYDLKGIVSNSLNIRFDEIIIRVERIDMFDEFMKEVYKLNFKKIIFKLNSLRELVLTKKDLINLSRDINYKKIKIGCKSMTLTNWYRFFNFESYSFETHRDSDRFANMRIQFNKLYNSYALFRRLKNNYRKF